MENTHELLDGRVRLIQANALSIPLPDKSVHCCVTSPPYWGLRDYESADGQLGKEETPEEFVANLVEVFREVKRVLRDDGTVWLNLGDSYTGSGKGGNPDGGGKQSTNKGSQTVGCLYGKVGDVQRQIAQTNVTRNYTGLAPKNLVGIPWRVAFALQADGWYLRNDIIWVKPNPMPGSMKDRCTSSHEYIFLLSKEKKYYYDAEAIKEPTVTTSVKKFTDGGRDKQRGHSRQHAGFNGRYAEKLGETGVVPALRNKRDVWRVSPAQYREAHFATFPEKLIEPCILAGCPPYGIVLDPFGGSGTTARVAIDHGRQAVLLDLNYKDEPGSYLEMAKNRILAPKKEPKAKRELPVKNDYNLFKDSE